MATAKKAARKGVIKKAIAPLKKAADKAATDIKGEAQQLLQQGKLSLESMIEHANFHLMQRIKLPITTNEKIKQIADELQKAIVENVNKGLIHTELKGKELLDYIGANLQVPQKMTQQHGS